MQCLYVTVTHYNKLSLHIASFKLTHFESVKTKATGKIRQKHDFVFPKLVHNSILL